MFASDSQRLAAGGQDLDVCAVTLAVALQFAVAAIPTMPTSATPPVSKESAGGSDDPSAKSGLHPDVDTPNAGMGAPVIRQCDLGARVPNEVLGAMTMEDLVYLEDALCPMEPNSSTS